jgi:hypothetical protein
LDFTEVVLSLAVLLAKIHVTIEGTVISVVAMAAILGGVYAVARFRSHEGAPAAASVSAPIVLADFSVFAPESVSPDATFEIVTWIYQAGDRDRILARAAVAGGGVEKTVKAGVVLELGAQLLLQLCIDGLEVAESCDTVQWNGSATNAAFRVSAANAKPGEYPATIKVLQSGLPVTRLLFHIRVGTQEKAAAIDIERRDVKRAFASYSSRDRTAVLSRVQGIRASGISVFLDALSLRAGADWQKSLYAEIDRCDELFLFWSEAASKSEWVEREWRYALEKHGADFISPVPLADPRVAPPPADLRSKHFNDVILALLAMESAYQDGKKSSGVN